MTAPKTLVTRFPEKKAKKVAVVYHNGSIDRAGFERESKKLGTSIGDLVASVGDFALLTSENEAAIEHYGMAALHMRGLKLAFDQYLLVTREVK